MKSKILVLCTGNSCRSQMAEGILKELDKELEVFSAGTIPANVINPIAVKVMDEIGIDISAQYPKQDSVFINDSFDYVITVCDNAKESCPVFTGKVKNKLHISFEDPAIAMGCNEEILNVYRRTRDEIKTEFMRLYNQEICRL